MIEPEGELTMEWIIQTDSFNYYTLNKQAEFEWRLSSNSVWSMGCIDLSDGDVLLNWIS